MRIFISKTRSHTKGRLVRRPSTIWCRHSGNRTILAARVRGADQKALVNLTNCRAGYKMTQTITCVFPEQLIGCKQRARGYVMRQVLFLSFILGLFSGLICCWSYFSDTARWHVHLSKRRKSNFKDKEIIISVREVTKRIAVMQSKSWRLWILQMLRERNTLILGHWWKRRWFRTRRN